MIYALEVALRGLLGEILVNGVSVFRHTDPSPRSASLKLNGWILGGPNTFEVRLSAPWAGPTSPDGEDASACRVQLVGAPHGALPPEDATLVDYVWSAEESPLPPVVPTTVVRTEFDAEGYGGWAWEKATAGPLGDKDRNAALGLLTMVARALSSRDAMAVANLYRLKHEEMARALDVAFEEIEAGHRSSLQRWFDSPGWAVKPPHRATVVLRPGADERVFEVLGPSGAPALVGQAGASPADARTIPFPLFLARLSGSWKIVR